MDARSLLVLVGVEVALCVDVTTGGLNGLPFDQYSSREWNHSRSTFDGCPTSAGASLVALYGLELALYVDVATGGNDALAFAEDQFSVENEISGPAQADCLGNPGAAPTATIIAVMTTATAVTKIQRYPLRLTLNRRRRRRARVSPR
jgi:hypothetical protein